MHCFFERGRTMIETISVMAIIGVLSITSIYIYAQAMNGVRADAIVKDVLVRANQVKSNADLRDTGRSGRLVYSPNYRKESEQTYNTKGRYGYKYEVIKLNTGVDASLSENDERRYAKAERVGADGPYRGRYVVVKLHGKEIPKKICEAIVSKISAYKRNGKDNQIACMGTAQKTFSACSTIECPDGEAAQLYFGVKFLN